MNLIDVYIKEVTRWLPKKKRDDIALELESTIFDMLPDNYDKEDVYQVLEDLGDPAVLANKYSEKQMHLIGPKYYKVYVSLLRWILPVAVICSLITLVGVEFFDQVERDAALQTTLSIIGEVVLNAITVSIHVFVWITVIFAIIERVDGKNDDLPKWMDFKSWDPKNLWEAYNVPKRKSIQTSEIYVGLVWTAFWGVCYFFADHLLGIYENGEEGLRMVTPAFNQEVLMSFWPFVVLLIGAEIALAIYKLIKKQWTKNMANFYMIYSVPSVVTFIIILTQSKLFSVDFLAKISNWFNSTPEIVKDFTVWGSITLLMVFGGISIYDRYNKASIHQK